MPYAWTGRTGFDTSNGQWVYVEHNGPRQALMTPKQVKVLKLPKGIEWTGKRRTVVHPETHW